METRKPPCEPSGFTEFYMHSEDEKFVHCHTMDDFWSAVQAGKEAFIVFQDQSLRARKTADGSYICESMTYRSELFGELAEAKAWGDGGDTPPVLTEMIVSTV